LLLAVTVEPDRRNYPDVAFAVLDAAERQALRRARARTNEAQIARRWRR
jgi:hypothetical protein